MEVIKLQNLHKVYNQGTKAVDGLNLSIKKGEIYGFLGPNGAGKSTTIKMLIGLIQPTSGSIELYSSNEHNPKTRINDIKLGYVPQDLIFYQHLTVLENLTLFATLYELKDKDRIITDLLKLFEIESIANQRADTLSGGQKRRLNLALGLLNQPDILVLDEPSAGMDPQSRNILWDSIKSIKEKNHVTIILTTHLMETVDRLADRIGIIDNGKIIAEGTPEELKQSFGTGDILEISIDPEFSYNEDQVLEQLKLKIPSSSITVQNNQIKILKQNIISEFSEIFNQLNSVIEKKHILNVAMHENTLEDVFIYLTGKELRE